jgi:hypothetical protein
MLEVTTIIIAIPTKLYPLFISVILLLIVLKLALFVLSDSYPDIYGPLLVLN